MEEKKNQKEASFFVKSEIISINEFIRRYLKEKLFKKFVILKLFEMKL